MRNERNSLRQAAITAGILTSLGVCTLGGDLPRIWAAEPSNNVAQAEAKTEAAQDVQPAEATTVDGMSFDLEGVTVEGKRPDWEAKLSPGTVTVIRPDDYKGEQKDLPDLLKMVPGVHVRELNGKGQYTTVSVRGSTAAQVGVFVDGVLFNLGGDAAADISTIPVHNVERIEVYRGYIPARFGGTFMGGVINIVTKRPTKANVQASFGKSSFGGYKGNLQIDAPLGGGALMVGINRDQSDGDFKYKNFANDARYQMELERLNTAIYGDPNNPTIGGKMGILYVNKVIEEYTDGGIGGAIENYLSMDQCMDILNSDLPEMREKLNQIRDDLYQYCPDEFKDTWNDDFQVGVANMFESIVAYKDVVKTYESPERWRKANDYKNTDAIIKWQDDHWLAKATWKQIKRHLPFPYDSNYASLAGIDTDGPTHSLVGGTNDGSNFFGNPLEISVSDKRVRIAFPKGKAVRLLVIFAYCIVFVW